MMTFLQVILNFFQKDTCIEGNTYRFKTFSIECLAAKTCQLLTAKLGISKLYRKRKKITITRLFTI